MMAKTDHITGSAKEPIQYYITDISGQVLTRRMEDRAGGAAPAARF